MQSPGTPIGGQDRGPEIGILSSTVIKEDNQCSSPRFHSQGPQQPRKGSRAGLGAEGLGDPFPLQVQSKERPLGSEELGHSHDFAKSVASCPESAGPLWATTPRATWSSGRLHTHLAVPMPRAGKWKLPAGSGQQGWNHAL